MPLSDPLGLLPRIRDLEQANELLLQRLTDAAHVQRTLLPQSHPTVPGYEFFDHYQPACEAGGDLFDLFVLPDGKLAAFVAEVAGLGLPAAIMAAYLQGLTRAILPSMTDPARALARLNWKLCQTGTEHFICMALVLLDPTDGNFQYANAAHMPPLLYRRELTPLEETPGLPLGIQDGRYSTGKGKLNPGDCLVLLSDGLAEAQDHSGRLLCQDGVRALAVPGLSAAELGTRIVEGVREFQVRQMDDQTVVVIGRRVR